MNGKAWLVLIVFLGWSALSWRWYTCGIKGYCSPDDNIEIAVDESDNDQPEIIKVEEDSVTAVDNSRNFALRFPEGSATIDIGDQWEEYRTELLSKAEENGVLLIEAGASPLEIGDTYSTLAISRAGALKALLADHVDTANIETGSFEIPNYDGSGFVEGIKFNWKGRNIEKVEENISGATVWFIYDSDQRIADPVVEEYLLTLAEKLKSTGRSISITGHTDGLGSEKYNHALALQRANSIREFLVLHGVSANKISVDSKGETEPLESNDTAKGQEKNRRAEIVITD